MPSPSEAQANSGVAATSGRAPTCWPCASTTATRPSAPSRELGVRVVRSDATLSVIDPADTGGVQIALTDTLLPGDPRR